MDAKRFHTFIESHYILEPLLVQKHSELYKQIYVSSDNKAYNLIPKIFPVICELCNEVAPNTVRIHYTYSTISKSWRKRCDCRSDPLEETQEDK